MKNIKKLLSIVMMLALVLSLGASAFAATIKIEGTKPENDELELTDHTYEAYQIFKGTQKADGNDNNPLGEIEWGDGIDSSEFMSGLAAAFGNEFVDKNGATPTTAKGVAEFLDAHRTESGFGEKVAKIAEDCIVEGKGIKLEVGTDNEVVDGYYLIVDTTNVEGKQSERNQSMLQVTGTITITPKYDVPKSEKKVMDTNDTIDGPITVKPGPTNDQWQDTADHDIGDTVYFKLTGTLPTDLEDYDSYALTFHDEESAGLNFQSDTVEVYVDGVRLTDTTKYSVVTEGLDDDCTFEVRFENVKDILGVGNGSVITVVYGSKLEGDGVKIGSEGNPNEMYMEYTNKSDNTGKGKTKPDTVIVFTYELDTNKVDGASEELDGAGFTLLKKYAQPDDNASHALDPEYNYENVQKAAEGSWLVEKDAEGNITGYWKVVGVITDAEAGSDFDFKGIDNGTYRLVETEVPAGYNKADDIEFTVSATHTNDPGELKLETLTASGKTVDPDKPIEVEMKASATTGKIDTTVMNQQGLQLPETGGIGTTIFYAIGAILVVGAVILLVTRKRVSGASK